MSPSSNIYAFDKFELDEEARTLKSDKNLIELTATEYELLLYFVQNPRKAHRYADLYEEARGMDGKSQENTIPTHVSNLSKKLREYSNSKLIKNLPNFGYRFEADVTPSPKSEEDLFLPNEDHAKISFSTSKHLIYSIGEHSNFVLINSLMFGVLFWVALLLEIAYQFEKYGPSALLLGLPLVLFITITSVTALAWTGQLVRKNDQGAFFFGLLFFSSISVLSYLSLTPFLPNEKITVAIWLQTQPASAAFFKNAVIYFLPLGVFFLLVPFYLVSRLKTEISNAKTIGPWRIIAIVVAIMLSLFWLAALIYSLNSTFYLFDNLRTGDFHFLFVVLALLRFSLWFGISLAGLIWFILWILKLKDEDVQGSTKIFNSAIVLSRWQYIVSLGLISFSLLATWSLAHSSKNAPRLERVEVVTAATRGQQFFVNLYGTNFEPETVLVRVSGEGCPEAAPCAVPNDALRKHGEISETFIKNVPLTLAKGEFQVAVQNDDSPMSNYVLLTVP